MPARVRPRDAASLVLYRRDADGVSVLMGRRAKRAAFIPDAFVFPGGRLSRADFACVPQRPLAPPTAKALALRGAAKGSMAPALAAAAIRETREETGLCIGGTAPDLGVLAFLGRAITPSQSPIRFHARFFVAPAAEAHGVLGGDGELRDLAFYPVQVALGMPIVDVTEYMLGRIAAAAAAGEISDPAFWSYRGGTPIAARRAPDCPVQPFP